MTDAFAVRPAGHAITEDTKVSSVSGDGGKDSSSRCELHTVMPVGILTARVFTSLERWRLDMRTFLFTSLVVGLVISGFGMESERVSAADNSPSGKVYDMRIYKANPGKLEALNARFRDHTCKIFERLGMEIIGFWTPTDGEDAKDTLIYIVAFPNAEAQKKAWDAFWADPEWKKVKADSERDGVLVKEIKAKNLKATDYSPLK